MKKKVLNFLFRISKIAFFNTSLVNLIGLKLNPSVINRIIVICIFKVKNRLYFQKYFLGDGKENQMNMKKDYDDIPGTIVFDADQSRRGYHLNQFCISMRLQKNREAFNKDEDGYLDQFPMTDEQRQAVINREWNRMLELGGNIYYTSKLAANDGINFQELAGIMTGMGNEAYRAMMLAGGRSPEGNLYYNEEKKGSKE